MLNRCVTTGDVELGGRHLPTESGVSLMWDSANRAEDVTGSPNGFRLDRGPAGTLVYGRASMCARARPWLG